MLVINGCQPKTWLHAKCLPQEMWLAAFSDSLLTPSWNIQQCHRVNYQVLENTSTFPNSVMHSDTNLHPDTNYTPSPKRSQMGTKGVNQNWRPHPLNKYLCKYSKWNKHCFLESIFSQLFLLEVSQKHCLRVESVSERDVPPPPPASRVPVLTVPPQPGDTDLP